MTNVKHFDDFAAFLDSIDDTIHVWLVTIQ
jgi:hypothetical protein